MNYRFTIVLVALSSPLALAGPKISYVGPTPTPRIANDITATPKPRPRIANDIAGTPAPRPRIANDMHSAPLPTTNASSALTTKEKP